MKKKIIICVFCALILVTAIAFLATAIDSYLYDMDPDNGVDILEGFGAVLIAGVGGFCRFIRIGFVLYGLLLFCKTKNKNKNPAKYFFKSQFGSGFCLCLPG